MPNQLNYPDTIPNPYIAVRPERLSAADRRLTQVGTKQVVFGTTERDHAELWVYDSNGSIAGHINLFATDPSLSLTTVIDNTGAYELLNIDMGNAAKLMTIESGRYGFVANFFRDEVGSEIGNKLYIKDISDDRTELRLYPKSVSAEILQELYEWIVPSVPKPAAQALINQTFAQSEDFTSEESLNPANISLDLANISPSTIPRIRYADAEHTYNLMITQLVDSAGKLALENMALDVNNLNVQDADLERYIKAAVIETIRRLKDSGQLDPRFEVF